MNKSMLVAQKTSNRCFKTTSKEVIEKSVEATGDLIENKITVPTQSDEDLLKLQIKIPKERYI